MTGEMSERFKVTSAKRLLGNARRGLDQRWRFTRVTEETPNQILLDSPSRKQTTFVATARSRFVVNTTTTCCAVLAQPPQIPAISSPGLRIAGMR